MGKTELRKNINQLVNKIENEQLLHSIYHLLKSREFGNQSPGWNSLTEDQKKELMIAFTESDDEDNLLEREKAI